MKKYIRIFSLVLILLFLLCSFSCGDDRYTISFDADGGTLSFTDKKINYEDEIEFPEGVKAGYKLVCFVYQYDGKEYVLEKGDKYYYQSDITVKAIWAPENSFTVKYVLDGGFFMGNGVYSYYGNDDGGEIPNAVKWGYYFNGYRINGEGEPIRDLVLSGLTGDKILYADYRKVDYNVRLVLTCEADSFLKEGETEQVKCTYQGETEKTFTVSYGYALPLADATPELSDYVFLCWRYYDKDGNLKIFYPLDAENATVFNESNFVLDKEVVIYVCCVPIMSEFI